MRMHAQFSIVSSLVAGFCFSLFASERLAAEEVLPKHITPETLKAVRDGLDYLADPSRRRRLA